MIGPRSVFESCPSCGVRGGARYNDICWPCTGLKPLPVGYDSPRGGGQIPQVEVDARSRVIDAVAAVSGGVFEYGSVNSFGSLCPVCAEPMGVTFGPHDVSFDCWGGCEEQKITGALFPASERRAAA